jgi:integrase/recombinase XerD
MGEARHLDRTDVDLQAGVLAIVDSKFGKSRELPLHGSAVEALAAYDARRDQLCRVIRSTSFFVGEFRGSKHSQRVQRISRRA